jgi:hypothetical protein
MHDSGAKRRGNVGACFRHCEERSDEAIHSFLCGKMDCFASLAMTVWLFENRIGKKHQEGAGAIWARRRRRPIVRMVPKPIKNSATLLTMP